MQIIKFFVGVIIGLGILGGGYWYFARKSSTPTLQTSPIVSITGKISAVGPAVSIQSADGKVTELLSRKIDMTPYNGKTMTVTGQFSGTVLYVDTVK